MLGTGATQVESNVYACPAGTIGACCLSNVSFRNSQFLLFRVCGLGRRRTNLRDEIRLGRGRRCEGAIVG